MNRFNDLDGPYLGQKMPDSLPSMFAPELVSTMLHEHSFPTFSNNGKFMLWNSSFIDNGNYFPTRVIMTKNTDKGWSNPEFFKAIPFNNSFEAFITKNDDKIFFSSNESSQSVGGLDIWFVEGTATGWTAPKNLGSTINSIYDETQPTLASNGNLYFYRSGHEDHNQNGIYYSELKDDEYQEPIILPYPINTEYMDWTPFIAQDESYLLFSSHRPNQESGKSGDLYISYRISKEEWMEPINLGSIINSKDSQERYPYVIEDINILFFVSNRVNKKLRFNTSCDFGNYKNLIVSPENSWNDIYWVRANFIEDLRPE